MPKYGLEPEGFRYYGSFVAVDLGSQSMKCIDLDREFGEQYQIRNESGIASKPRQNDPLLREIRCLYGVIYPFQFNTLAAYSFAKGDQNKILERLVKIPGVKKHQIGDLEGTVLFEHGSKTEKKVFELMRPRRKKSGDELRLLPDAPQK